MYVCMYACMYVCMYVCVCMYDIYRKGKKKLGVKNIQITEKGLESKNKRVRTLCKIAFICKQFYTVTVPEEMN